MQLLKPLGVVRFTVFPRLDTREDAVASPSNQVPTIARMTICDYHVVMKQTGIADLKARLSEYLRLVRRGDTVTILDRETPVARIVPVHSAGLHVRKPAAGAPPPNRVPLPPPANLPIDVVELLLEERQGGR
jgi:prevent-host-death family protein